MLSHQQKLLIAFFQYVYELFVGYPPMNHHNLRLIKDGRSQVPLYRSRPLGTPLLVGCVPLNLSQFLL
jgi:hypothetical protein